MSDEKMEIWTAKIGCYDTDELNISRKSGNLAFAPTTDLMVWYQQGDISQALYTDVYLKCMAQSRVANREEWDKLTKRKRVVLTCYCRAGVFCHRVLLAEYLERLGLGVYKGEL